MHACTHAPCALPGASSPRLQPGHYLRPARLVPCPRAAAYRRPVGGPQAHVAHQRNDPLAAAGGRVQRRLLGRPGLLRAVRVGSDKKSEVS